MTDLDQKYQRMREILRELGSVAVAFSAGVDSTLVLKVAVDTLGAKNVVAATGKSDSLAQVEFEQAQSLARQMGVEHVVVETDEMANPNYAANPVNRCYYCKSALYEHLTKLIAERGLGAIVNGANAEDCHDFRPGEQAAREYRVRAPAAEAGLTKADLRDLSRRLGLETFDKPASPCLASRLPYGESVTPEKLHMIERAEAFLHKLGFPECRVRHHGTLARIEVPKAQIPALADPATSTQVTEHLTALGYHYVAIDLRGFRSGSLNEAISVGKMD